MSTAVGAPSPERLSARQWGVVLTASLAALLEVLDTSITNVALTSIQASLGATLAEVGWVVTGYTMANVVMIPLIAWLGDVFGQNRTFLFSLAGFTVASVLCGLAPTLPALVAARILQGLLGGGLLAKAQSIMFQAVPPSLQGKTQGVFGVVLLAGPALGPTLGGLLTDALGWRWIFFVNLPFGILAVLMALAVMPPERSSELSRSRSGVDWIGIGLLILCLASLQIVLEQGRQLDWFASKAIVQLALLSAVSLPVFVAWELSQRRPAVDLRVLRHRTLAAGCLFSMVLGLGLYGTVFVVPIFAQSVLGYTATQTGLLLLPGALASALSMGLLSRQVARFDPRLLIVTGSLLMVLTMGWIGAISPNTGEDSLYWPLILRGVATVMMFLPLSLASLGSLPREEVGAGSGLFNLTRQLGGSFGIALLTVVIDQRSSLHRARLVESLSTTNPLLLDHLQELQQWLQSRGSAAGQVKNQALDLLNQQVNQQAALLAFGDVFQVVGVVFLAAIPLVLLLGRPAVAPAP
ncbi:DHA2 family efflux MFS transporter permease subunit [Synechococcus sp. CS-1325]|uniref:DHA2 family efflux MFS transporter permease subunit n=1 Tax=Synechococcus sp. CS-1325 TaxID=2847979 RepID=UPI0021E4E0F6|nr:DHA2 family efflux MFS transporter permease subunit [Synechococcus sp. CS-1325]MCT0198814.1 DHA2 family efflux MFS transporter permease subunit [Synechococcus sp. CS-1325]